MHLACWLHDASEAYLSDVTRPVKQELPKYLEIEKPLQEAIWRKYLGLELTEEGYLMGIGRSEKVRKIKEQ